MMSSCNTLETVTIRFVFPQNGQTARSVAEGAAHQEIRDLLKAHAETRGPESFFTTDLQWHPNHSRSPTNNRTIYTTFCPPTKRKKDFTQMNYRQEDTIQDLVCRVKKVDVLGCWGPVGVYGNAAFNHSVDRQQMRPCGFDDKALPWWQLTGNHIWDRVRILKGSRDGPNRKWMKRCSKNVCFLSYQRALQAKILSTWSTFQIYNIKYDIISIFPSWDWHYHFHIWIWKWLRNDTHHICRMLFECIILIQKQRKLYFLLHFFFIVFV